MAATRRMGPSGCSVPIRRGSTATPTSVSIAARRAFVSSVLSIGCLTSAYCGWTSVREAGDEHPASDCARPLLERLPQPASSVADALFQLGGQPGRGDAAYRAALA